MKNVMLDCFKTEKRLKEAKEIIIFYYLNQFKKEDKEYIKENVSFQSKQFKKKDGELVLRNTKTVNDILQNRIYILKHTKRILNLKEDIEKQLLSFN